MALYSSTTSARGARPAGGERDSLLVDVNQFSDDDGGGGVGVGGGGSINGVGRAPAPTYGAGASKAHVMDEALFGALDDGGAGSSAATRGGQVGVDEAELVPGQVGPDGAYFYRTLANTVQPLPLPRGVIEVVEGDLAHHPFPALPASGGGKVGMALMKATGVGYAYYRAANTRIRPGEITWLQDGSEQYVVARPGLYYFPGPTRTLHPPQRLDGQEQIVLGNTKVVTVPPGRVGFCSFKNQTYILNPGTQYVLNSPYISYEGSASLNSETIERESVTLVRIQAGQFVVVRDAEGHVCVISDVGRILLRAPEVLLGVFSTTVARVDIEGYQRVRLLAGEMVFYNDNAGLTRFFDTPGVYELRAPASFIGGTHKSAENVVSEGSITIVRVQTGQMAIVRTEIGDVVCCEEPRRYVLRAPAGLLGVYSVNEPRIEHGTYERVRLQEGEFVFYQTEDGVTQYYDQPGTYSLKRPAFFDKDLHDVSAPLLSFGSIVRVNLRHGEVTFKFTRDGNTELITEPGVHIIQRPEQFGGRVYNKWERHLSLGAYDIVNVPPGFVAITYDGRPRGGSAKAAEVRGAMTTSDSALRILPEGHHVLDHELWTLQEIKSIQEKRLDLECKVYSRNRVAFAVSAFVLFRVIDPKRAFIDVEDIEEELRREAEATLLSVFGAHDSQEISQGANDPVAHAGSSDAGPPSYEQASFADVVRSAFTTNIREFADERGVQLTRMRVEGMDFADKKMKDAIEAQAEVSIQIAAERQNVEQRNQTLLLQAQGKAAAINVEADAEANAKRAATRAEVDRIESVAKAQNVASETPLAVQLALIEAYAAGQAQIFAALGDKVSLLPTDLRVSAGGLPDQIRQMLAGDGMGGAGVASLFSAPSASGGAGTGA